MTRSLGQSIIVAVDEVSKVGDARRRLVGLANQIGFDVTAQGTAALIATEAASNLLKHAGGGQLIVQALTCEPSRPYLEILSIDSGRGMSDLSRCLADGYSSAGSPGTGLGAISRLANRLEIYSTPDEGTVLWARVDHQAPQSASRGSGLDLGVVRVAVPGETVCGDDWATSERDGQSFIMVADGLGHGPAAAHAAEEAVRIFHGHRSPEPEEILESIHLGIRGTRGAAVAITRLDVAHGQVRYAGVGNISGVILNTRTGDTATMVSHNGTVGYTIRKIKSFDYEWTGDSLLLMHSDGLATHWSLDRYTGLGLRYPSIVAGVLYRDYKRGRDDVTVVVARQEREERL